MKLMVNFLVVGAAGSLGAMARYGVVVLCARLFGTGFPAGTLVVNLSGSFLVGWFFTLAEGRLAVSDTTRLAMTVGFAGAYTTFSTLMYESNALAEDGAGIKASINLFGSLLLGLAALRLGMILAQRWHLA